MKLPSTSPVTLLFGATTPPYSPSNPHQGIDFAHIPDDKIYAPFAGTATLKPNNGNDGNGIYMTNGDQFHGMLHSSQYLVSNGEKVSEGQPIGVMGDSGFAQGVHLHWCVKVNGVFIDPLILVREEDMNSGDIENLYLAGWQRNATPDELKTWVGKDMKDFFYGGGKAQYEYLWQQVKTLQAQSTQQGTVLTPGKYTVEG